MPKLLSGQNEVNYELAGPDGGPRYVLVNGLTQYAALWRPLRDALAEAGFRVVTFDLLGQGESDKPGLFIGLDDQVAMLRDLIAATGGGRPVFLAGISFGGVVALRYAIAHGATLAGLVPMSTFAALTPQLLLLGTALRNGLVLGGIGYLQDLLLPMNVSDAWLEPRLDKLDAVKRPGWLVNDLCALQNLMESFVTFKPMTEDLPRISAPCMILNGEFDFLTTRPMHDAIRAGVPDSALVIVPRAYHAFTLEKPLLTADLLRRFAEDVLAGHWAGGGAVRVAPEEPGGAILPFPEGFDPLRAIPAPFAVPQSHAPKRKRKRARGAGGER